MPKVSVIIPVYNASKFIERCCRSLFEQTLDDMEFIFVDDGSSDNSLELIEHLFEPYPQRKNQSKLLRHSPNRGVSFTRQEGLNAATGEYVIHCDSDDWVEPQMYETMYDIALRLQADVVCCGFTIDYSNGDSRNVTYNQAGVLSSIEFNIAPLTGSLVNKLVRRSMLMEADVSFPESINWGEDFYVSICGLLIASRVYCLQDCFYHYYQQDDSITHTISRNRGLELLGIGTAVEHFLKQQNLLDKYSFQLNYLKFQLKSSFLRRKEIRDVKLWKKTYPECHNDIMRYSNANYIKIVAWLVVHNLSCLGLVVLKTYDLYQKSRS